MRRSAYYTAAVKRHLRDHGIDANEVWPGIYQGAFPRHGAFVKHAGFDVLALCALEHQPPARRFPGVEVLHVPLDDWPEGPNESEWLAAKKAARYCAQAVNAGAVILVTCHLGINRSGFVSALTICALTGLPGAVAVDAVQRGRSGALVNPGFVSLLRKIPPGRRVFPFKGRPPAPTFSSRPR
jgi:hypothetical protein